MEIKYLKKLEANPNDISAYDGSITFTIKGMTETEIQAFETYLKDRFTITDPNFKLPQAYREYLFLAGKGSYLFETGGGGLEMLQRIADHQLDSENEVLPHPFCAVDCGGDVLRFFYLTDTNEDPVIWQILYPDFSDSGNLEFVNFGPFSRSVEWKIGRMLEGKSYL